MKTQTNTDLAAGHVLPRRIWALLDSDADRLVPAAEATGNPFLAFASKAEAEDAAEEQSAVYGIKCSPVRLA